MFTVASQLSETSILWGLAGLGWLIALTVYRNREQLTKPDQSKLIYKFKTPSSELDPTRGPITLKGLEKIRNHQYRSGGSTRVDDILNIWWTWIANYVPSWVAPNLVTLTGLFGLAPAFFLVIYYDSHIEAERPRYLGIIAGVALFIYQTLDAVDGKHARRMRASSPLGQLFDHGVDAFCCTFASYPIISGLGFSEYQFFLMLTSVQLAFIGAQWVERHTHVLATNVGYVGVTEGQIFAYTFSILSAFIPFAVFHLPLSTLVPTYTPWLINSLVTVSSFLPPIVSTSLTQLSHWLTINWIITILISGSNALIVLEQIGMVWRYFRQQQSTDQPGLKRRLLRAILETLPVIGLVILHYSWLHLPSYRIYPALTQCVIGLLFSHITNQMIVSAMSGDTYPIIQPSLAPLLFLVVHDLAPLFFPYAPSSPFNSALLVWFVFILALFTQISWVIRATRQIARHLDIYIFKLGKPSLDASTNTDDNDDE